VPKSSALANAGIPGVPGFCTRASSTNHPLGTDQVDIEATKPDGVNGNDTILKNWAECGVKESTQVLNLYSDTATSLYFEESYFVFAPLRS